VNFDGIWRTGGSAEPRTASNKPPPSTPPTDWTAYAISWGSAYTAGGLVSVITTTHTVYVTNTGDHTVSVTTPNR